MAHPLGGRRLLVAVADDALYERVERLLTEAIEGATLCRAAGSVDRADLDAVDCVVVARLGWDALPTTLGALVALGGLTLAVPAGVGGVADVASLYLVLLAVLTLPHAVVVAALDRAQGVW